ncbi:hypothetical protein [Kitasatospora camelliae]|uniref:Uncharacterized protein n=1 Tax=Kitasatospora camelliae TaxID=3156397 RepID=A0AAU8K7P9_9ACTN
MMMVDDFFRPGKAYRHHKGGRPSGEGVFVVACVGTAPDGFEYPSEVGGVAFGWRRGTGPSGREEPLGSYVTPDFAGWVELDDAALHAVLGDQH